ncbi:MAG TPA: HAMP domain-containing sensor histidine kinase, partial [Candidatus Methylacidiphilales bacterium]
TEAQFDEIRGILRVDLHRIHASIENILQWSSGQIAAPRSSPGPFLLADAVGEAIGLLSVVAKDKGIVFDVHIPEDAAVVADAGQLRAVLRNLLANAVKFSRRGGIVAVASSLSQRAGNVEGAEWIVSVSDPGSGGVSGAAAVRRFLSDGEKAEPAWGTAGERGFGLGLRLCRDFIEANGGMIGAEELPGGGTRVWVSVRALLAVVGEADGAGGGSPTPART